MFQVKILEKDSEPEMFQVKILEKDSEPEMN